jgi:DNA-binding MarR family transcriptional regulator
LSSFSQDEHANIREEFSREIRQFTGIYASFFRVAAARIGIAVTDMQVLDILDLVGPATAGQLADFTGLTTGAITRILDRLEKAGLVRRERDSNDGRKVIVHLERGKDEMNKVRSILDSVEKTWREVASRYDDEQIVFLLEFLRYSNTRSRKELAQLQQEAPAGEGEIFSEPLEGQESGRLVVSCGISRLIVRADEEMAGLYEARFEGPVPGVKTKDGVVTIRYPRRLLGLGSTLLSRGGSRSRAEPQKLSSNWVDSISRDWKSKEDLTPSAWISPRPRAGFPYGSPEERQRLPCAAL